MGNLLLPYGIEFRFNFITEVLRVLTHFADSHFRGITARRQARDAFAHLAHQQIDRRNLLIAKELQMGVLKVGRVNSR